jgi:hypothetical protein
MPAARARGRSAARPTESAQRALPLRLRQVAPLAGAPAESLMGRGCGGAYWAARANCLPRGGLLADHVARSARFYGAG